MSIMDAVRSRLSVKISLILAATMLVLTGIAAAVITMRETKQMEQVMLEKARLASALGARSSGDVLDAAIDAGLISLNDAFDRNYVEIKGHNWGAKTKYHTKYDFVTDRNLLAFEDKFLEYKDFVYAVAVDENGFIPSHNTIYQKQLIGDVQKDNMENRTKRFFNNQVELTAARNREPSLLQVYHRDTGETMWDLASPIYVKGKFWGNFRLGASMIHIEARQRSLFFEVVVIFALFALVTIGVTFVVVQRSMKPVQALTVAAEQISLGEALDTPLKPSTIDEIGRLTKMIDRLRASMKAAMSRLGA